MEKGSNSSFVLRCRDDTGCFSYHCWTWDCPTHQDSDCEGRAKSAFGPGLGRWSFEPSAQWLPLDLPLECCCRCQLPWWLKRNINIQDLTNEHVVRSRPDKTFDQTKKKQKHLKFQSAKIQNAAATAGGAAQVNICKGKSQTSSWIHAAVVPAVITSRTIGLQATAEDRKQTPW